MGEVVNGLLDISELIVSLATVDEDLALVCGLGVIDQLNCSVQLLDRSCCPTLPQQQQTMLRSCHDPQMVESSTIGKLLSVYQ